MPDNEEKERGAIVFLHVARCGGSTLQNLLDQYFANSRILKANLLHRVGDCVEGIAGHSGAPISLKGELHQFRCISGHNNLDDLLTIFPDASYITTLRDPVKRVVSLYNYWRSHTQRFVEKNRLRGPALARSLPLEDFIQSQAPEARFSVCNGMARQLFRGLTSELEGREEDLVAEAIERIDRFAFVGLTDMFDLSVWLLCETFGWAYPVEFQDANRHTQNALNVELFEPVDQTPPSAAVQARIRELNPIDCALYEHAKRRFEMACCAALGQRGTRDRRGSARKGEPPLLLKRIASRAIRVLTGYIHPVER